MCVIDRDAPSQLQREDLSHLNIVVEILTPQLKISVVTTVKGLPLYLTLSHDTCITNE
jgi:hypothetical protein